MAYFECITGSASSGDGVALIVECDSNFAGSVITADNGEDIFTETCPSVSPYTVRFEGIPTGTYTISGVSQGQTFTTQFTVLDYETTLNATPEGATVLPINDIQIWLNCANIWDKSYTTLDEVLADNTTLLALISDHNAVDYMARSTNWASSVCANSTAMGYIGNNNYCANALLADSTWLNAICNSTYFESVLNVKVPTMTSDTTPSGVVSAISIYASYSAYKAFDSNISTGWATNDLTNAWIQYKFSQAMCAKRIGLAVAYTSGNPQISQYKISGSNDGSNWTDLGTFNQTEAEGVIQYNVLSNNTKYLYYRLTVLNHNGMPNAKEIQFYGRA